MASLAEVVEELKGQRKSTDLLVSNQKTLNDAITKFLAGKSSADRLQELEDKAEKKDPSGFMASFQAGQAAGEGARDINFGWLLNPMGLLGGLLSGIAAVAAAFAGLRGWEATALRNIDSIRDGIRAIFSPIANIATRMTTAFTSFVDDIVRGTLTRFGIDPTTGRMSRDALGRFTGKETKTTIQMIQEAMEAFRGRVFTFFGLGPAGGLADDALRVADDAPGVISRVTSAFGRIMTPFRAIYEGIESFITGPGAKIFGFIDGVLGISRIGAAAGGLLKVMGKILWPIGILMSIFDGVSAYQDEEGSQYDRITAGISAAIGDFLGAPLDLIKNLAAWVVGKFGFDETAEAIQNFSFEETIGNLFNGIFDYVGSAVNWVKTLFTDPSEALSQLWTGIVGEGGLIDLLFAPVRSAIDWITKTLGWREEDAPTFSFGELIQEGIDGVVEMFRNAFAALPSFEEIKAAIVASLPSWMVPDSFKTPEMRIQERERAIAEEQDRISRSEAGENIYFGRETAGREESRAEIERLNAEIESLRADRAQRIEPTANERIEPTAIQPTESSITPAPSSQTGSALRTADVVEAVRERSNQPVVVPVPVPQPAPAPAPSNGGGAGGAYLLPDAPTMDLMDGVPMYDPSFYLGRIGG